MTTALAQAKRQRKERSLAPLGERYDAIVIGSGIGGLTSAALLANRGLSVLVLEMHYEVGGCATVFDRRGRNQGYQFDVGFHYLGDCEENGLLPCILESLDIDPISFIEQERDGFDRLCFPDFEFAIPRNIEVYRARLKEHFPSESAGIDRYVDLLVQVWGLMQFKKAPLKSLGVIPKSLLALKYKDATLAQFLDTCTRDPRLRAVIAGQHGLYLQPPSRVSLMLHAGVATHLFKGAFYPAGGGQSLSDRLAAKIESKGGTILLQARARRILVENGRVRGVEVDSKRHGQTVVEAPIVISNADPKQTFLQLLDDADTPARHRRKVEGYEMSPGFAVAYLGVRKSFRKDGWRNANLHIFPDHDFETVYADCRNGRFSARPHVFVSNSTIKDPANADAAPEGVFNLQVMAMAPSDLAAWGVCEEEFQSGTYRRSPLYRERKERIVEAMLTQADRVLPGMSDNIVYREISSPLTMRRFTGATNGTPYGLALTPAQFLNNRPGATTPLKGLYLCGVSTRNGHGIYGALMSGVEAYGAIFGRAAREKVLRKSRSYSLA
jgi:all-trans-retinol 13,14-reductase